MSAPTLSPTSPKVKRKYSARRQRVISLTQETHDAALYSIRAFLRSRTSYDAFPVSFRLIVLDSQLEVKKALQCLLLNGTHLLTSPTLQANLSQVSSPPPFGTARNPSLLECSQFLTLSISSNITIIHHPTTMLLQTWKPFVLNLYVVRALVRPLPRKN